MMADDFDGGHMVALSLTDRHETGRHFIEIDRWNLDENGRPDWGAQCAEFGAEIVRQAPNRYVVRVHVELAGPAKDQHGCFAVLPDIAQMIDNDNPSEVRATIGRYSTAEEARAGLNSCLEKSGYRLLTPASRDQDIS